MGFFGRSVSRAAQQTRRGARPYGVTRRGMTTEYRSSEGRETVVFAGATTEPAPHWIIVTLVGMVVSAVVALAVAGY